MMDTARWMGCGIGEFLFTYLGLPIEENMRRVNTWGPVVEKFKSRLADWKAKTMSFEGRLTLVSGGGDLGEREGFGRGRSGGRVWNDIVRIGEEIDGVGLDFSSSYVRVLGDGKDIRFWVNRWLLGEDDEFTIKELARLVGEKILHVENGGHETLWNRLVPKKVNIFMWMSLKGRLLVRVELDRRGIDLDSVLCPCCNDIVETCAHCLVTCDLAMSVWVKAVTWCNGSAAFG
ncbi:RNA-directed DNA polymerase, eukaryota, reverse transcriptase zinc-binding domain protein [Tanacetum coccineum]